MHEARPILRKRCRHEHDHAHRSHAHILLLRRFLSSCSSRMIYESTMHTAPLLLLKILWPPKPIIYYINIPKPQHDEPKSQWTTRERQTIKMSGEYACAVIITMLIWCDAITLRCSRLRTQHRDGEGEAVRARETFIARLWSPSINEPVLTIFSPPSDMLQVHHRRPSPAYYCADTRLNSITMSKEEYCWRCDETERKEREWRYTRPERAHYEREREAKRATMKTRAYHHILLLPDLNPTVRESEERGTQRKKRGTW
jgi:hypothetical protein